MPHLTLRLLGTPTIQQDGQAAGIARQKAVALLSYLAVSGGQHAREALAALLWPDLGQQKSLAALRSTLWDLNRTLGEEWLAADRKTLGLSPEADVWVDVRQFTQAVDMARKHAGSQGGQSAGATRAALAEAAELYRGDFLHGFTLRDSPAFDDWQSFQTEHLRRQMTRALEQLVVACTEEGELAAAIAYAKRHTAIDRLSEPAHRSLMRLYAWTGARSDALKQYATCVDVLLEELGVRPQEETSRLHDAIKAGALLPPRGKHGVRSHAHALVDSSPESSPTPKVEANSALPAHATPFIGREQELELIAQRLADPGCRLLTLTGPGGVGKTRVALETARRRAETHPDGVAFVPLTAVGSPGLLASAVAGALKLPSTGHETPEERLVEHIRSRSMLVVLDNFEHILDGATLLAQLLERAPGVKLLVTSRERLHLRGEWEMILDGLPFPRDAASAEGQFDAVELFVRTATRVDASFALTRENACSIAQICRMLGGMPLGIELAAAWVRHATCAEIAAQIERDLGFLSAPRDVPERHRSMRATFAYSWNLLSDLEKGALRRLAVFCGSFTAAAAEQVAGASIGVLAALVSKSLVRRTQARRYELQELIRQFAAEELEAVPEEHGPAHDRHASYYAALLEEKRAELDGPGQRAAMEAIEPELDNVREAWRRAVEAGRYEIIDQALDGLCCVQEILGQYREAEAALRSAVEAVKRASASRPALSRLLGRLLARRGRFALEVGLLAEASASLEESVRILRESDAQADVAYALGAAGRLASLQGNHAAARWCFSGSLTIGQTLGDKRIIATAMSNLSTVAFEQGERDKARRLLEKSLDMFRSMGDGRNVAACLSSLGALLDLGGELERAEAAYREGLLILEEAGDPYRNGTLLGRLARVLCLKGDWAGSRRSYDECLKIGRTLHHLETVATALYGLGIVSFRQGDHEQARRQLEESLSLRRKLNAVQGIAESLNGLGLVASAQGEVERAQGHFRAALEMAIEVGASTLSLDILVGLAELPGSEEARSRSQRALARVISHPAVDPSTRERAARLLEGSDRCSSVPEAAPMSSALRRDADAMPLSDIAALVYEVLGSAPS